MQVPFQHFASSRTQPTLLHVVSVACVGKITFAEPYSCFSTGRWVENKQTVYVSGCLDYTTEQTHAVTLYVLQTLPFDAGAQKNISVFFINYIVKENRAWYTN